MPAVPAPVNEGPRPRVNCAALNMAVAVDNAPPKVNNPSPAAATPPNINPKFPSINYDIPSTSREFLGFEKKFKRPTKNLPPKRVRKNPKIL